MNNKLKYKQTSTLSHKGVIIYKLVIKSTY